MYIHKYIRELISKYREVYKKDPRGFNYDEWNSLEQYGECLKSEINKETLRKRIKNSIVSNKKILLDNKNIYSIDEQIDFYKENYVLKGDEHKGKFKLQKTYSSINKEHFNLIYKDKIIGKGWIRKKLSYIRKGMYLYIAPDYRKQGYGTIFYNLLAIEMTKKDIDFIILKVNKYDNVAINFLDKQINQYEKRYNFFNKRIFIDTLIVN